MENYKETFETWNKVASLYEEKFMELDIYDSTYDFICSAIQVRNAAILEIGCGPGNITLYLLSKRPDYRITGIDIAPRMIELAIKNNPAADFLVMDSRSIHILTSKYDGIICGFCIPYLSPSDVSKLIADAALLLNREGLIYLSFVEGDPASSGFQTASTGDRTYFYYHQLSSLELELRNSNFEILRVFNVDYPKSETEKAVHTILTARKV